MFYWCGKASFEKSNELLLKTLTLLRRPRTRGYVQKYAQIQKCKPCNYDFTGIQAFLALKIVLRMLDLSCLQICFNQKVCYSICFFVWKTLYPGLAVLIVPRPFSCQKIYIQVLDRPCFVTSTSTAKNYNGWWELGCFHKTSVKNTLAVSCVKI